MAKCSFCSRQIEQGKGVIFVAFARVYNFCSSKCMKNFQLGRESSKLAWVRKTGKGKTKAELKEELLHEEKMHEEKAEEEKEKKEEKKAESKSGKEQEKPAEKEPAK